MLGITRVDPIRHELLFERFINEGRTAYPDVDIDFSSERREEVIQYVYERYGAEHTGMVCNLVTYRARSAVREVGYALGFPRPLVDRVAKALETYDSVMVRRDLEAEGGFAQFFARPGEVAGDGATRVDQRVAAETAVTAAACRSPEARGLTDAMGQLEPPARRPVRGSWRRAGRRPRRVRRIDVGRGRPASPEPRQPRMRPPGRARPIRGQAIGDPRWHERASRRAGRTSAAGAMARRARGGPTAAGTVGTSRRARASAPVAPTTRAAPATPR